MTFKTSRLWIGAAACALVPVMAQADGFGTITQTAPVVVQQPTTQLAFPGILGVASAIPGPGGTGFVALNYVDPRGGVAGSDSDGSLSLGYTFGNPVEGVSATVIANITSLTDSFGDSGNFSFSLSRMIRAGGNSATFVGLSAGNVAGWGDAEDDDTNYSVQASHLVAFPTAGATEVPVQFVLGYGNETTLSDDGLGTIGEGLFYGVGVGVTESVAVSLSGTETQFNLGVNLSVPQVPGLGLSAGLLDVHDNTNRQQFTLGAAFAF